MVTLAAHLWSSNINFAKWPALAFGRLVLEPYLKSLANCCRSQSLRGKIQLFDVRSPQGQPPQSAKLEQSQLAIATCSRLWKSLWKSPYALWQQLSHCKSDICLIQGQHQEVNRWYLRQGQQTALLIDNMTRLTKSEPKRNPSRCRIKGERKHNWKCFYQLWERLKCIDLTLLYLVWVSTEQHRMQYGF